jgi:hypothetical protein
MDNDLVGLAAQIDQLRVLEREVKILAWVLGLDA